MPDVRRWIKNGVTYDLVSKTDSTLTQNNIPGDAKVIGDKLTEINDKIDNFAENKTVFNADTHFDFPSIGSVDCIYKAYKEKKTYQWNEEKLIYEPLIGTIDDIQIINGGNANDRD